MKRIATLALAALTFTMLTGCTGLMNEAEKSEVNKAPAEAVIAGHDLQFTATLTKHPTGKGNAFDLHGAINISAKDGNFPTNLTVSSFSLKPSWKGWPGYYVINFFNDRGQWYNPGASIYVGTDPYFTGSSVLANGIYTIQFTWHNQGHGAGTKPEHFTAYDVSVVLADTAKKDHRLAHLNVPVTPAE